MPKLDINSRKPEDVRAGLEILAKLLPAGKTMLLVDTKSVEEVRHAIQDLRQYLPEAKLVIPDEIPPEWAPYDELVTRAAVLELAERYPAASGYLKKEIKDGSYYWPCFGIAHEPFKDIPFKDIPFKDIPFKDIPFKDKLYKGHFFHVAYQNWLKNQSAKRYRFWQWVVQQWNLPHTPTGWIPPDLRE